MVGHLLHGEVDRELLALMESDPIALCVMTTHGFAVYATTPSATVAHSDVDLTAPVALVVGSESTGLTDAWLAESGILIPMTGTIDSLNASVAAGIVLFEAVRQRRVAGSG